MDKIEEYLTCVTTLQMKAIREQKEKIRLIAKTMAETTLSGGNIWVFGASHSGMVAEELMYRAGGCALFNGMFAPTMMLNHHPANVTSKYEQLEGSGHLLFQSYPVKKGDFFLIYSVSGRNSVGIELALDAKEMGVYVACITSVPYTSAVKSRHSSGKKLIDIADQYLDCYSEVGDACLSFEGMPHKVAPTSTVISLTLANSILIAYTEHMLSVGEKPPILQSGNRDGGMDWNNEIFKKYASQIHYL